MKKITTLEYLKAKRIVDHYMLQQQLGKYQFLYWTEGDDDEQIREKYITATSIEAACKKFLALMPSDTVKVDYEVMFQGNYYDISKYPAFENLL